MKMYLSSYKLGNRTDILKDWLNEYNRKVLLITNSRDAKVQDNTEKEKILENVKMLEEIGFEVKLLDLKKYFNKYDELLEDIKQYYSFCVIGGNVFVLRQAMRLSGFDRFLQKIKNDNRYIYIGYSAGSCVLSNSLHGLDIVDEPINPYNSDPVIYDGVGIIDFSIAPHYKSDHKESQLVDKLVEYFEKNNIQYKPIKDGEVIII